MQRREFIKLGATCAALMGLSTKLAPELAHGLARAGEENKSILWLQGQSCSGCSVSLLNAEQPTFFQIITQSISLQFHSVLSAATGEVAQNTVENIIQSRNYYLVAEGSLPEGMPEACTFGGDYFQDLLRRAAENSEAVISAGTCAAFGGIPAADGNKTGAVSVTKYLQGQNINSVINIPGCPMHPDWMTGVIAHLTTWGVPELDEKHRPKTFFGQTVHDNCPRYAYYAQEQFARHPGETGCLFLVGCLGPITKSDCTLRKWNEGINHCIDANAPCAGCASEGFALDRDFPFYTLEHKHWTIY